ncbi:hypothetical protein ALT_7020 [Aspergillus lentulus]|uniref:Uncharacterized protein n=1 Tax=Aspergillus lentulus TaxID=293939 RepID=A0AAN6BSM6_ASPLE|nr:uncharacterized protein IFM58399_03937 [Aspergillus lentulus]KAF4152936.1 hypothetical protein CNMCM6069_001485 [Aspergillus lentulus]KAF4163001.1 hypothetical protein CNMCM6936_001372 [Aspergillus lentulus]KAF4172648.1 hypothetical protein CNMCM8060_001289 [Aspergillus lentulus]KAF4188343.1 hypothetical protein CNMCM7927_002016 [Aspergillus lentulus]KAF4196717.1 hypothetical protein CNMCM8694_004439 [Aspergillus lentulus]
MTSTPAAEHTSRSLSESWAALSASDAHSEDGTRSEQTDAGSLIDQTGPDDVASLDDQYSCSEADAVGEDDTDEEEYNQKINNSESQELPSLFAQTDDAIDGSNLTAKTAFYQSSESIQFVEPEQWPEAERVELKHTIRVIDSLESTELLEHLGCDYQDSLLTITVQQTMTKRSLDTEKPFRVLYIGHSDYRTIILDKIGDVLVSSSCSSYESSSTESSRYHVVPTAFGAGAVPNFAELLPIHVQLIVDECVQASSDAQTEDSGAISMIFKNRPPCTSSWSGLDYTVSSSSEWALPDVAILFLSTMDTLDAVETQKLARIFMERHGVPTLMISEKPLWKMVSEPIPLNYHSLHMCLESRHPTTGKSTVLRRYPIDLKTFESITPGQLNRNLASLAEVYPRVPSKTRLHLSNSPEGTEKRFFSTEIFNRAISGVYYRNDDHDWTPLLRLSIMTIVFMTAITLCYSALQVTTVSLLHLFSQPTFSNTPSPAVMTSPSSLLSMGGLGQTSLSAPSASAEEVQLLTSQYFGRSHFGNINSGVASGPAQEAKSNHFQIQVVGDCHLILKPPRTFFSMKKQPKFDVQISRNNVSLAYEFSKLFEGVYTLRLDRGDAYGVVDIVITADTKPFLNQTMSVDLGTPWLKIASWKRAAQAISSQLARDLNSAHTGLTGAYSRLCTDLQLMMGDVVRKAHFLRHEADIIRQGSAQFSLETRVAVMSTSKQLSEVVKRTAVQPFLAASSVIQSHTDRFSREARGLMGDTWNKVSTSARSLDLETFKRQMRNARKCDALDRAQRRVKSLMRRKASPHLGDSS